jgi:hypothetical protein
MSALSAIGPCSNPTVREIIQQSNEVHEANKARAGVPEGVPRPAETNNADTRSPYGSALSHSSSSVQAALLDLAAGK